MTAMEDIGICLTNPFVVGSKEYRVFGTLRCRTFGINAVEELALTNTEFVSKVDQIFLRFEESLPVLQAVTITG